jgi:quercetin dioxygenase-like cupin family protein
MKVNILREIPWFGGNYFHPISFDESIFKMEGCLRAGKSTPMHSHKYFDEHWTVVKGTPTFIVGKEKFVRNPGETFYAAKNVAHALLNDTKEDIILVTEMRPAADMAKMMAIIAGLQDDGERNWMIKYFFLEKKAGLKEFSSPTSISIRLMMAIMMPFIMIIGHMSGWNTLINKYI